MAENTGSPIIYSYARVFGWASCGRARDIIGLPVDQSHPKDARIIKYLFVIFRSNIQASCGEIGISNELPLISNLSCTCIDTFA